MSILLRPGTPMDAAVCGAICFEAFKAIDDEHNFPWDFPSAEVATGLLTMMLSNPGFYSVVAEQEGNIVGSNFLDERGPIAGVGPITVDPASQNQTIGRRLMSAVLDRTSGRDAGPRRRAPRQDHCLRYRCRVLRPCRRRDKPRSKGADRSGPALPRRRISAADAEWGPVPLVPGKRPAPGAPADLDDDWSLQRTRRCVSTVGAILTEQTIAGARPQPDNWDLDI
jgi:GNAT superfamily N-acetyltransferase